MRIREVIINAVKEGGVGIEGTAQGGIEGAVASLSHAGHGPVTGTARAVTVTVTVSR